MASGRGQPKLSVHRTVDDPREKTKQYLRAATFGSWCCKRIIHKRIFLVDNQVDFVLDFKFAWTSRDWRIGWRWTGRPCCEFDVYRVRFGAYEATGA